MVIPGGHAPTMLEFVERLAELGCRVRNLSGEIVTLEGTASIRHVFNPQNSRFVVLPMFDDHKEVSIWFVGNTERRLVVNTGFKRL